MSNLTKVEKLQAILLAGIASLVTFLLTSYFSNFITHAEYRPDNFVMKEKYNEDKINLTTNLSTISSDMNTLKSDVVEIKKDVKELIKAGR